MENAIFEHLAFLYDKPSAHTLLPQLNEIIQKYDRALEGLRRVSASGLDERDVILIVYGDQVYKSGVHPLQTLGKFMSAKAQGIISGIHILPFYPFSSDDGFSVVDYLQVDPALGSWKDVRQLGNQFQLMFDLVLNHVSAHSEWFQRFLQDDPIYRDFFIVVEGHPDLSQVVRPRALPLLTEFETAAGKRKVWTTFSPDQIDLNYKNPKVLLAMLDVLLFYVVQGACCIRLDAIAYLWKEIGTTCIHLPQTHAVVQLFRAVLDEVAPWVCLITETNVPHADNISYFGDGANEAQLVYNFALPPLVLHTFGTSDTTALSRWAQTLTLPSDQVTYFNFLASHDGIGLNPVRGILSDTEIGALVSRTLEHGGFVSTKQDADGTTSPYELNINYFDMLSQPNSTEPISTQVNRFMTAQAIMLSLAGVPGIYVHSLLGSHGDRAGAESSGIPRRINRQKFELAELENELGKSESLRAQVLSRYSELLRLRRAHCAFAPHAEQHIISCDSRVLAILRVASDLSERVLCLHNVADQAVTVHLAKNMENESWRDLINKQNFALDSDGVYKITLQPYQTIWAIQQNAFDAPNQRMRTKTQVNYDRMSRWYDLLAHASEKKYMEAGMQMLAVQEGETVLEIGFGTGHSMVALARAVGTLGKVYGIDISEAMQRLAQSRVNSSELARRVIMEWGDAKTLAFPASRFDAVFMSFTLELFNPHEIPVVLAECYRVMRSSGRLGIVALSKKDKPGAMTRFYEVAHRQFPDYIDCRPIDVARVLTHSGFKITSATEKSMWGLPVAIVVATKAERGNDQDEF